MIGEAGVADNLSGRRIGHLVQMIISELIRGLQRRLDRSVPTGWTVIGQAVTFRRGAPGWVMPASPYWKGI